jgi:hypothetical protein
MFDLVGQAPRRRGTPPESKRRSQIHPARGDTVPAYREPAWNSRERHVHEAQAKRRGPVRHAVRVPELTCATSIKLNKRVSLRPIQTSLAWPQSRRLAPKFSLRTARSGAASYPRGGPAPQYKGHAALHCMA